MRVSCIISCKIKINNSTDTPVSAYSSVAPAELLLAGISR